MMLALAPSMRRELVLVSAIHLTQEYEMFAANADEYKKRMKKKKEEESGESDRQITLSKREYAEMRYKQLQYDKLMEEKNETNTD